MAHPGHRVDQKKFCCSICFDFLKDPVTTSCGHSYCRSCINNHWDTQDQRRVYSCPQCRQTFRKRPNLKKNTMLAALVEELKKTGPQAAPAPPLKKHKLGELSKKLQENICSRHKEVMKMFCRTDQQSICYLCSLDQHKGHDTVSAESERTERQRELQVSRQNIQQRIQQIEGHVKELQQGVGIINSSADKAVEKSEEILTELIRVLEQRRSDVTQQLRSQQEAEVGQVRELKERLEQEISELKTKDKELEKLSHTQDHNQFLQDYPSVSQLREPTDLSRISERPLGNFEYVTAAVSELREKLRDVLRGTWTNTSETADVQMDVLLSEPESEPEPEPESEPRTRAQFLRYSRDITLDLNTAHEQLLLSDENRKVTLMREDQPYSDNPDRFTVYKQVLSKEGLTGRCYWEVELSGEEVHVAVSYRNIDRSDQFGWTNKSWSLYCDTNKYVFSYDSILGTEVSGPWSSRIGVYLDHRAGILSFYSVSETMTLLHRVQTTFSRPLHAGLRIDCVGDSAELCKLK